MSSSKVIKSHRLKELTVCAFDYASLVDGLPSAAEGGDAFIPLQVSDCHRGDDASLSSLPALREEAPAAESFASTICEEELSRQVEEAYQRGIEEGRRQAERGLGNVFKALREGTAGITGLREKVLRESEDDLLKLAILVARKIIQQEITQDPKILSQIIGVAIGGLAEQDRITIRLNPTDYALVNANRQLYLPWTGEGAQINLTPDEAILPGGCMVDTATGTVDARIDVQLDEIYRRFMEDRGVPVEITNE